MLRCGRVGIVAAVVGVVAIGLATGANARDATRDFPKFAKCPVHSRALDASVPDPNQFLLFKATTPTATLTFLSCDDRAFDFESINLSIDDLTVIEKSLFNANRLKYPDQVPDSYRIAKYDANQQAACYVGHPVDDVLDRSIVTRAPKRFVPLLEDFEGDCRDWTLINATLEIDPIDNGLFTPVTASRSLILARGQRGGQRAASCSSASTTLRNLVKGRQYVIDFSWFATGFEHAQDPPSESGQNLLTVSVKDTKGVELMP